MADLIRDGSVERLFLVVIVFGGIVVLQVTQRPFDTRLFDLAFLMAGWYFRTVAQAAANHISKEGRANNAD